MKLIIGYLYSNLLNLYGDNGNVEILHYRASMRGIDVEIRYIDINTKITSELIQDINFVFMGGGPDASQKEMYIDLITNKRTFLSDYINSGGVGLFICGAYQLLGSYYKSADGSVLEGLSIFDCYTEHFGNHKPRCIGNVVTQFNTQLAEDKILSSDVYGNYLVGFENHGGRTYLSKSATPFCIFKKDMQDTKGFGNNGEDFTEGIHFKNSIGTYLHGPVLSKNPHFADYLLTKALKLEPLPIVEDNIIKLAHLTARKLDQ